MTKITVKSPSNIAFIKYWGKTDPKTRLPKNSSLSMCLDSLYSLCTVEFNSKYINDDIKFLGEKVVKPAEINRIVATLDKIRQTAGITQFAKVRTKNNFPKAVGIASSASGLSALAYSALTSAGVKLNQRDLTIFCRQLSGSASRSIPDGFVEWHKGTDSQSSYAESIFSPDHWDVADLICIVPSSMKKISSTQGHALVGTSPFQSIVPNYRQLQLKHIKTAIKQKNFTSFGQILEKDAMVLHSVCFTSSPPLIYWQPATLSIIRTALSLREAGLEVYFTIDAGPSVHIIAQGKDVTKVKNKLSNIVGVSQVIVARPALGAKIINQHLF